MAKKKIKYVKCMVSCLDENGMILTHKECNGDVEHNEETPSEVESYVCLHCNKVISKDEVEFPQAESLEYPQPYMWNS